MNNYELSVLILVILLIYCLINALLLITFKIGKQKIAGITLIVLVHTRENAQF